MTATASGLPLTRLINLMEHLYPPILAESWDSIGLTTGDPTQVIKKVLLAVDPVTTVIDEAIKLKVDLIITHHPLFLKPVHSVAASTFKGNAIHQLTRNGIALYNAHTNADSAPRGVADALAAAIGLENRKPLVPKPLDEAAPKADPPEPTMTHGIGRIGSLPSPMTLAEFAQQVVRALPPTAQPARVAGDLNAPVRRVAVVGGAGDSLFDAVRTQDVDVYVTADLRHHPASEERERAEFEARAWPNSPAKPFLVDVSHFASEWPWLKFAAADLAAACRAEGGEVEFIVSHRNTDPWTALVGPHGVIDLKESNAK